MADMVHLPTPGYSRFSDPTNHDVLNFFFSKIRCKIVDKHLALLAPKHVETKFCKINATKCPFLVERLKIR